MTGGRTGKPFAAAVQNLLGASVEVVKRNELHTFVVLLHGASEDMGAGGVLRLAGKAPPTLEELRRKAEYQPANGGACLHGVNPEKIVNRLLDTRRPPPGAGGSVSSSPEGVLAFNPFSDDYWPFAEPRKDLWFRFNCLACLVSVAWRETAGNHQAKSAWPLPGPFSPFPGNAG